MNADNYCVIMAGGIGSRFWPISRSAKPKQFLDILGTGKSFIRHTYERFTPTIPAGNFLVVTNLAYKDLVLEQLPELRPEQVLCEPIGRNTAPCIAYAAFRLAAQNPNATMIVAPSDHLVLDGQTFLQVAAQGIDFARENDALVTIGIKPTRPDTGYGYIQVENYNPSDVISKVKTFTEKPNLELARAFVESGEFFWNSGIFIWSAQSILRALHTFQPEIYQLFASIAEDYGTPREQEQINRIYPECRGISIDFGVMEKACNVYVRCSDFGWSDIGTWGSLYQYAAKDEAGNAASENALLFDTHGCIVKLPADKIAVIEGLDDYIVVENDHVLMICPKSGEQNIKKFIDTVKYSKGDRFI